MSNFTKWLVDKGHTPSEDRYDIECAISADEAYHLYKIFIEEGGVDETD